MNTSGLSIAVLSVDNVRMSPSTSRKLLCGLQKAYWPETAPLFVRL